MSSREMFALPEAWPTVHCSIWLRLTVCCQNIGERFATIAVSCGSYGCSIFFWFAFMPHPPILKYSTMTGPCHRHRSCLRRTQIFLLTEGAVRERARGTESQSERVILRGPHEQVDRRRSLPSFATFVAFVKPAQNIA